MFGFDSDHLLTLVAGMAKSLSAIADDLHYFREQHEQGKGLNPHD